MHHRKAYMYINFQQNRVSRSIKTVPTNLLAKHRKLHKVATCNSNFEKSRLTGMNCPIADIQVDLEINHITKKKMFFHRRQMDRHTDGETDRRTDRRRVRQQQTVFSKKEKILKNV